nr:MAG TPA: hypothetical protein [Crassvirales sp.]
MIINVSNYYSNKVSVTALFALCLISLILHIMPIIYNMSKGLYVYAIYSIYKVYSVYKVYRVYKVYYLY